MAYLERRRALTSINVSPGSPIQDAEYTQRRDERMHRGAHGRRSYRVLEQTLTRYEKAVPRSTGVTCVSRKDQLIPLARTHLASANWKEIDEAFAGHWDPLFGGESTGHYDELFRRVVNLAPAPIGVGPPQ